METLYKLTDADGYTQRGGHGETLWEPGKTMTVEFGGELCATGCLHAYKTGLIAAFMDPIHGRYLSRPTKGRLWEAKGNVRLDDGTKVGCDRLAVVREIKIPEISSAARVRAAIYLARETARVTGRGLPAAWTAWAERWLSDEDRSEAAARVAEAWAVAGATRAARAAAEAAAWSTWTRVAAVTAAWAAGAAEAARAKAEAGVRFDLHAIIERAIADEARV